MRCFPRRVIPPVTGVLGVGSAAGLNDDIASRWGPRTVESLRSRTVALSRHRAGQ